MSELAMPLPEITKYNRYFFCGGKEGKLFLQQCENCGELIYYPKVACPNCLSMALQWKPISGMGSLYSYSLVWRPQHPASFAKIPLALVAVNLDEGPTILSHLVNCPPDAIHIGMRVRVVFERLAEQIYLPKFEPAP